MAAGLRGGKGVPETVAGHPRLFVTFTAPPSAQSSLGERRGRWSIPAIPCVAPLPGFTADLLERAVRRAAAAVAVPCPAVDDGQGMTLAAWWGEQLDVRHITEAGAEPELSAEQMAGHVARYASKSTEALGVTLDHRIGDAELDDPDPPAHVVELVRACLELATRPSLAELRLGKGAHMLGFGGHRCRTPTAMCFPAWTSKPPADRRLILGAGDRFRGCFVSKP